MAEVEAVIAGQRGALLLREFERDPLPHTLDQAIVALSRAVQLPSEDQRRASNLHELGKAYRTRYTYFDDVAALDASIDAYNQAVVLMEPANAAWIFLPSNLGTAYADRYQLRQDPEDLSNAEQNYRCGLTRVPEGHPDRAGALTLLSSILLIRHAQTGRYVHLEEAVSLCRRAVSAASTDLHMRAHAHYQASLAFLQLYLATGDEAAAMEAELQAREGLSAAPDDYGAAGRADLLAAHGTALHVLGAQDTSLDTLEQARLLFVQALDSAPARFSRRPGLRHEMANVLETMYRRTGDQALLDEAIACGRAVLIEMAPESVDAAGAAHTLATRLRLRYDATNSPEDLNQALLAHREAVERLPEGDTFRPAALAALGVALMELSEHTPEPTARNVHITEAVGHARMAAACTTTQQPAHLMALTQSALVLSAAAKATRDPHLLDEADEQLRRVLDEPSARKTPAYRIALNNRALILGDGSRGAVDEDTVEKLLREAVAATPPDDVHYVKAQSNLAVCLTRRHRATGDRAARDEALALRTALATHPAPVASRIRNFVSIAGLHAASGEWRAATDSYGKAVGLLQTAARLGLGPEGRAHGLSEFFALAADAAACALNCGDHMLALELLERGRGILVDQATEARRILRHAGRHATAQQSDRVAQLLSVLNSSPTAGPVSSQGIAWLAGDSDVVRDRLSAEQELTRLLDDIGYLSPIRRSAAELVERLHPAPVAVINISRHRCDALLVAAGRVTVLPLTDVTWDGVLEQATALAGMLSSDTARDLIQPGTATAAASTVDGILAWLWQAIARPVLDFYGITAPIGTGEWPRLWWCPTGPAAFLPLHAAGRHHGGAAGPAAEATIDRVVSSYTLTLGHLADSIIRRPAPRSSRRSAHAIGIAEAPGQDELPSVEAELSALTARIPGLQVVRGAIATRQEVLKRIGTADWFHFAGHGYQHPLHGRDALLLAYDASTSGAITADDVVAAGRGSGQLAYLSACDSSRGRFALADEGAHVAGAFKAAGFRHVVATAWYLGDEAAATVAGLFYEALGGGDDVALALHHAVRRYRHRGTGRRRSALSWGPFMHFGP